MEFVGISTASDRQYIQSTGFRSHGEHKNIEHNWAYNASGASDASASHSNSMRQILTMALAVRVFKKTGLHAQDSPVRITHLEVRAKLRSPGKARIFAGHQCEPLPYLHAH